MPYTTLRDAMLTHPTLVEGLIRLFFREGSKSLKVSNDLPGAAGSEISKFT